MSFPTPNASFAQHSPLPFVPHRWARDRKLGAKRRGVCVSPRVSPLLCPDHEPASAETHLPALAPDRRICVLPGPPRRASGGPPALLGGPPALLGHTCVLARPPRRASALLGHSYVLPDPGVSIGGPSALLGVGEARWAQAQGYGRTCPIAARWGGRRLWWGRASQGGPKRKGMGALPPMQRVGT